MTDIATRRLGWGLIALAWGTSAYLLLHYAAVMLLGPDRLMQMLGEGAYNTLIPVGGFPLLLVIAIAAAVWVVPFCLVFIPASLLLRLAGNLTRPRRLWAAAVVAGTLTLSLPFVMLDGWPWALMPLVWEDDTEFAPGYSTVGFWLVRPGMSPAQVVGKVGPPLERYPIRPGEEGWRWTRSLHDSSYRVRVVTFRSGRVSERISEFYVD